MTAQVGVEQTHVSDEFTRHSEWQEYRKGDRSICRQEVDLSQLIASGTLDEAPVTLILNWDRGGD
jgi:hypothetical protein